MPTPDPDQLTTFEAPGMIRARGRVELEADALTNLAQIIIELDESEGYFSGLITYYDNLAERHEVQVGFYNDDENEKYNHYVVFGG